MLAAGFPGSLTTPAEGCWKPICDAARGQGPTREVAKETAWGLADGLRVTYKKGRWEWPRALGRSTGGEEVQRTRDARQESELRRPCIPSAQRMGHPVSHQAECAAFLQDFGSPPSFIMDPPPRAQFPPCA